MSNFDFLKNININLYNIIVDAEKLFRDEYFEQSIVQVRRFAENLSKDILQENMPENVTFDDIIQKIKDNSFENIRKKEFVDDLYFIKNNGNQAVHSADFSVNPEIALECIERAFEISILYSHLKNGFDEKLDKTLFNEELLVLENKPKKKLKEKYQKALNEERIIKAEKNIRKLKNSTKQVNRTTKKKKIITVNSAINSETTNFVKIIFFILSTLFLTLVLSFWLRCLQ